MHAGQQATLIHETSDSSRGCHLCRHRLVMLGSAGTLQRNARYYLHKDRTANAWQLLRPSAATVVGRLLVML